MPSVLAIIGARGGSKTLPGKNIAPLGGKPLIVWTIEAALAAVRVERVIVTTDSAEIAKVAQLAGAEVPFIRPSELSQDDTPGNLPVVHAVRWLEGREGTSYDLVVYLQPTSPLRTAADIDAAIDLQIERDADSVVSVTPAGEHPYWMKTVDKDGWMQDLVKLETPIVLRQDLPAAYLLNGAIYLAKRDVLLSTGGWATDRTAAYVMPADRSVDIDTAEDFASAESVLARK
jgi:CMP-N,N'-diacetyllegionaminic acid synthase